jgi:hypothetical protein
MAMKKIAFICGLLVAGLFAVTPQAKANLLAPGGTVTPDLLTLGSPSIVADTGILSWTAGGESGQYRALVLSGVTGTCTGCLTFLIDVANDASSSDSLSRITTSSFAGYITDVGYTTDQTDCGADVNPTSVDRKTNGGTIGFNWTSVAAGGNGLIEPGTCSPILMIETNATNWTRGTLALIDSVTTNLVGFAPIPLPLAGAGLPGLILACVGLIALARRRKQFAAAV